MGFKKSIRTRDESGILKRCLPLELEHLSGLFKRYGFGEQPSQVRIDRHESRDDVTVGHVDYAPSHQSQKMPSFIEITQNESKNESPPLKLGEGGAIPAERGSSSRSSRSKDDILEVFYSKVGEENLGMEDLDSDF